MKKVYWSEWEGAVCTHMCTCTKCSLILEHNGVFYGPAKEYILSYFSVVDYLDKVFG